MNCSILSCRIIKELAKESIENIPRKNIFIDLKYQDKPNDTNVVTKLIKRADLRANL
jgi:hypothetical protein